MATASPPPVGAREAALARVLAKASIDDSLAALDEYAWRSLLAGMRVREYCAAASHAVRNAPPKGLRLALVHSPTRLLFPFALPAGAPAPPSPSSFIPPHAFPHLTRRQLVEAFVRLAREPGQPSIIEARVHELVLEYVGRRWRAENGVVESIARKLAEVELEVMQLEPLATTSVLTALYDFRFQLGLVTTTQLVTRLGSPGVATRSTGDTTQLLRAWAVRRLSSGVEPQTVADNLVAMRERLGGMGDAVPGVLALFCLDGRSIRTNPDEPRPRQRTLSRISLRSPKRRTLPIPQWLSPRTSPQGNTKLQQYDYERRPSLPAVISPAAELSPFSNSTPPCPRTSTSPISRLDTPTSDNSSPCSTPPSSGQFRSSFDHPTPLPNLLGLSDLQSERVPLVDHLLHLRYNLGPDADSWYLGCGCDKAADFLIGVEAASEPHMKEVVAKLRSAFGLPVVVIPMRTLPTTPDAAMTLHQRDVSFDLEQYLDDIDPIGNDDKEVSAVEMDDTPPASTALTLHIRSDSTSSVSTLCSVLTTDSIATSLAGASLSDFSIHEATRRVPVSAKATAFQFPPKPRKDAVDDASLPAPLPPLNYPRFAKSMPNVKDVYTRMPERSGRRRRSTKDFPLPPLLPAFDPDSKQPAPRLHGSLPTRGPRPRFRPPPSPTMFNGYTFPPAASPLGFIPADNSAERRTSDVEMDVPSPRRPSFDEGDRSRRQMYRQCVIVGGARVSPHASRIPSPRSDARDGTALGAVLSLLRPGGNSDNVTSQMVETKLLEAVRNEEERLIALGEPFDAEARARLAWLFEQVAQELACPELVAAVDHVLHKISSPRNSGTTHIIARPHHSFSDTRTGTRTLSITVPPRERGSLEIEVESPSMRKRSLSAFGTSGERSRPPASANSPIALSSDKDTTPTMGEHEISTPTPMCSSDPESSLLAASIPSTSTLSRRSAIRSPGTHNLAQTPTPKRRPPHSPPTSPADPSSPVGSGSPWSTRAHLHHRVGHISPTSVRGSRSSFSTAATRGSHTRISPVSARASHTTTSSASTGASYTTAISASARTSDTPPDLSPHSPSTSPSALIHAM